eukprot:TRINITY_DN1364_c0_g1_i2.p1 TRINITY_DN1364_c0_g1~~TRINITY_DN1364_c0_g1_i2.p1  ORF type:complete len:639 (+),score=130.75 TRINITY_DN1364_c0_g1_i2:186-2102(+)
MAMQYSAEGESPYIEPDEEFVEPNDLPNLRYRQGGAFQFEADLDEGEVVYDQGVEGEGDDEGIEPEQGVLRPTGGLLPEPTSGALLPQHQQQHRAPRRTRLYQVPDKIKSFILYFQKQVRDRNVYEIHSVYESTWNKLTEKFFKSTPWTPVEQIASLVGDDRVFLTLYKELYYRHIYSKLNPNIQNRIDSWRTYQELFNYFILSPNPVDLELPNQWLWDIIDEFVYQYQSFCQSRSKNKGKADERRILADHPDVWSTQKVLYYLHALINKSRILNTLERENQIRYNKVNPETLPPLDDFQKHSLYRMLGYFSIIGLVRLHCMLGDYHLALKTLEPIDLTNKKGLFTRVTACHITLYYYLSFAYLMMRRYVDTIKSLITILLYISRTKQYHTRSYQYESMMKKNDQMYALLAIGVALCPQRIDENVHSLLREKYGDHLNKMQRGEESGFNTFRDLFSFACPKFVLPTIPDTGDEDNGKEALHHQQKLFLQEVVQQSPIPIIRSYLKLYSTISIEKLVSFLQEPPKEGEPEVKQPDEDDVRSFLACFKHKSHNLVWSPVQNTYTPPLSGRVLSSSDVDFYVDTDMVTIVDSKVVRRYGDFFIRHINKFEDILKDVSNAPVPTPTTPTTTTGKSSGSSAGR